MDENIFSTAVFNIESDKDISVVFKRFEDVGHSVYISFGKSRTFPNSFGFSIEAYNAASLLYNATVSFIEKLIDKKTWSFDELSKAIDDDWSGSWIQYTDGDLITDSTNLMSFIRFLERNRKTGEGDQNERSTKA